MKKFYALVFGGLIGLGLYAFVTENNVNIPVLGGAGNASHLQVATTTAIGPDEVITLFSDTENCKARVVSTVASPIMLIFGDPVNGDLASTTLSGVLGHVQSASTTVTYSSDDLGCGRISAFGFASTTITTSSF